MAKYHVKKDDLQTLEECIQQSKNHIENIPVYPFTHAQINEEKRAVDKTMMRTIYGSPQMMQEYADSKHTKAGCHTHANHKKICMYCGNHITDQTRYCSGCGKYIQVTSDPEETITFCQNCGRDIPCIAKFCPYCGMQTRMNSLQQRTIRQDIPIACVYASPDMMYRSEKKEGILSKLFKRKK